MEIEKKYLVNRLPEDLQKYPCVTIEQGYLSVNPVIRIRRWMEEYILTYKRKEKGQGNEEDVCINEEIELPLTKEAYEHLKTKIDGVMIEKERYLIPYGKMKIELDLFHGSYEGLVLAEVEFETLEEAETFTRPDWFEKNVSGDYHYTNAYLALNKRNTTTFG